MFRALSVRIKTWLHYRMIFMPIMVQHALLIMLESLMESASDENEKKIYVLGDILKGLD